MKRSKLLYIILIFALIPGCSDNPVDNDGDTTLRFTSSPVESVYHNYSYNYEVSAEGGTGDLIYQAVNIPSWLSFNTGTRVLSGIATADNLGDHPARISVSDGEDTVYQDFTITVGLRRVSGGSWIGHFPHNWYHDGQSLTGEMCDVYSDASSDAIKQAILERAEYALSNIMQLCNIENQDIFIFPDSRTKIDVYANRFNTEYGGGFAYHGGAIVISLDNPRYQPNAGWCVNCIEHEMMHVVETLIEGSGHLAPDVWFREGIADHYAGNSEITSLYEMNNWLQYRSSMEGGGNPIKIHLWEDFPTEVEDNNYQGLWYQMFELAVRYCLDENGLGKSYVDVKNIFIDSSQNNMSFAEAFEIHMGIPVQYFEDNFFDIITDYLNN
ncbi:MAG: hypothetical protein GY863_06510 [bacterium]|nr:hypothetical protein [bacterium]